MLDRKTFVAKLIAFNLTIATPIFATGTTIDIHLLNATDGGSYMPYRSDISLAQTFTPGFSMTLTAVELESSSWASRTLEPLTISVYQLSSQDTPIGVLLGAATYTPAYGGIESFDFSAANITLIRGQLYSVVLSSPFSGNPDYANAVKFNPGWSYPDGVVTPNAYPDGMMWSTESGSWKPFASWISHDIAAISDIAMNTYGNPISSIPESSTALLTAFGLAGILWRQKRTQRT